MGGERAGHTLNRYLFIHNHQLDMAATLLELIMDGFCLVLADVVVDAQAGTLLGRG